MCPSTSTVGGCVFQPGTESYSLINHHFHFTSVYLRTLVSSREGFLRIMCVQGHRVLVMAVCRLCFSEQTTRAASLKVPNARAIVWPCPVSVRAEEQLPCSGELTCPTHVQGLMGLLLRQLSSRGSWFPQDGRGPAHPCRCHSWRWLSTLNE